MSAPVQGPWPHELPMDACRTCNAPLDPFRCPCCDQRRPVLRPGAWTVCLRCLTPMVFDTDMRVRLRLTGETIPIEIWTLIATLIAQQAKAPHA